MATYVAITALIFVIFAIVHAVRIARGWPVQIGPHSISMSLSWIALVIAAAIAIWGGMLLNS
jgi:hypothetical protein